MFKSKGTEFEVISKQMQRASKIGLEPSRPLRWARLIDTAEMSLYWLIPAITLAYFVVRIIRILGS
jgi:hypothetical protein